MFNYIINHEYKGKDKFFFILVICFIFVLPIILADSLYMDDKYRVMDGDFFWEDEGRYLTTFIFQLLSLNKDQALNMFPMTLIIGVLFFSYALFYTTERMNIKSSILNMLPLFFIICNPFFLQNLSYQYDSIAHLLSVGLILIAFFYDDKNKIKRILYPVILISISAFLYQPSINIYIVLFCLNLLFELKKTHFKRSIIKDTYNNAMIFLSGMFIYYIFYIIQFKFIFEKIYERNKLINLLDILKSYEISTKTFILMVKNFYNTPVFYLICFSFLFLILAIVLKINKSIKEKVSIKEKSINILIYLSIPLILYLSLWGPFILLKEKFFNPRDYVSVGSILMLFMYSLLLVGNKLKLLRGFLLFLVLINFFSISYIYGNVLKYENQYIGYINDNISRDLEMHHNEINGKKIFVFGRQGTSRYSQLTIEKIPYLNILLYPDNSNFFKSYDLYVKKVEKFGFLDNVKEWNYICKENIKPLVSTPTYEIYSFETYVSIWYKRTDDFCENIPTDRTNSFKELK